MTTAAFDVGGVVLPRPFNVRRFGHVGVFHPNLSAAQVFQGPLA